MDERVTASTLAARRWRGPVPWRARPWVAVLFIAPFFGECLSGATPPLDLLLPWYLVLMVGLYGCGALLVHELVHRYQLGLLGLCLLGAAFGVYEEGVVDRFWYKPTFWHDSGVGSYSVVWHTNLLLAVHLTAFHAAVSIAASILVVEWLYPRHQSQRWSGRRGLLVAVAVLFGFVPPYYALIADGPVGPQIVVAGVIGAILVGLALSLRSEPMRSTVVEVPIAPARRGLAPIAFAATAVHFILVYTVPSSPVGWPLGIAIAVAPIALGGYTVRRLATTGAYGRDGMRVITGILAFFVLLVGAIGLGGRYDLTAGAALAALLLRRIRRPETTD